MNNTYFILRHGQTPYQLKEEKILYPWPEREPILLTEKGKEQIKIVAEKLKSKKIDLIYSSDMPRARQTSEIVAEHLGVKINFDSRLRDIDTGIFQGKEAKDYFTYFSSPEERFIKAPPKGESLKDCQERIFGFLREIDKKHEAENILIVSHGDPLWLLEGKTKGLDRDELLKQKFEGRDIKVGEIRKLASG